MAFEFDHLFICTDVGAAAAERLIAFGLVEGSSNTHPGQGTANRRFFFHNAMLELLWVCDPAEAQSEIVCRTGLWERWRDRTTSACPFGFCLRHTESNDTIAFPSWDYCPPYLPKTMSIAVGINSEILAEPMLFQHPLGQRPDRFPAERAQPLNHPAGLREITRVELVSPAANEPSPAFQAAIATDRIKIRRGIAYCIEIGFDQEQQGKQADFCPELPLLLSW